MTLIEILSDAAIRLKKVFKDDENYNAAMKSLVCYIEGHLDTNEYDDQEEEEEALEEITNNWLDSIEMLKNAKLSEEDILDVILVNNKLLGFDDSTEDDEEYDEEEYDEEDNEEYDDEDEDGEYDDEEDEDDEDDDYTFFKPKKK